ncbi:hypothetical protein ACWD6P_15575 [Streptomyces sp. NPDC002446]
MSWLVAHWPVGESAGGCSGCLPSAAFRRLSGGTGDCQGFMDPGYDVDKDLTPINSIVLVRP